MPDVQNKYDDEHVTLWLENGIAFAKYKNTLINLDAAKSIVKERLKLFNDNSYPCLAYMMSKVDYTKDARDYFASNEGGKNMKCLALMISNPVQRIMGNFYLSVSKPSIPTKLFTREEEAIAWVNSFKN